MFLNNCDVRIVGGKELANGQVVMTHGTEYSIFVFNGFDERADAVISVDGKQIGTWRVNPRSSITIERPANEPRKLTFFRLDSIDAARAGINDVQLTDRGLVSARIIPEKARDYVAEVAMPAYKGGFFGGIGGQSTMRGFSSGCSGLGEQSGQRFGQAGPIDRDESRAFTINLRLVCHDDRQVSKITDVRQTPIPPMA